MRQKSCGDKQCARMLHLSDCTSRRSTKSKKFIVRWSSYCCRNFKYNRCKKEFALKFFLGICSILVFCLLSSCAYAALQSDIWQYCSYNYANSYQCFDTLDGAEAFMRTEPPSGPSGRRFLELTGDPQVSGSISNPDSISYSYTVKPRGPKEYLEDYTTSISKFIPNNGVKCGCGSSRSNVAR